MFTGRCVSPPVHLLVLLDFKHGDKNPAGATMMLRKRESEEKHKEKEQNL